ncbi:hypothetical protein BRUCa_2370 [Brucella melitensis]|nr:Hypothetical protein BSSP3_II0176 [Brucella suis bv. 2]AIB32371.1 Hypothetical protein BSSP2_II0176 [Brucella suis bv. 2]
MKTPDFGNIETRYGCNQPDVEQFDDFFWQVPIGDSRGSGLAARRQ